MHKYTVCPYQILTTYSTFHKVSHNFLERLRGDGMTNYDSSTFSFGNIYRFKRVCLFNTIGKLKKNNFEFSTDGKTFHSVTFCRCDIPTY